MKELIKTRRAFIAGLAALVVSMGVPSSTEKLLANRGSAPKRRYHDYDGLLVPREIKAEIIGRLRAGPTFRSRVRVLPLGLYL